MRVTTVAEKKQHILTLLGCVCILALVMWHVNWTFSVPHYNAILVCLALPYFSTLSHKQHNFWKKIMEHKIRLLISSTIFVWNISILWDEFSEVLPEMATDFHVKYPLFLSDFNQGWIFLTHFRNILKYQISWKAIQGEPSHSMWTER